MADPTLEERVAYLEGKVEEHSRGYASIREDIQRIQQHILHLDQKVDRFREELGGRIDALDQKVDRFREELGGRIDALDQKFSRWFAWLAGFLITALLAQLGMLGAALFRR